MNTYLVGGAVRDYMIRHQFGSSSVPASKDIDIALVADSFEAMREYLIATFSARIVHEDASKGVIRARIDTLTLPDEGVTGAILRSMSRDGDSIWIDFKLASTSVCGNIQIVDDISQDLATRDLTVNTMAIDMQTDEILDYYGGATDIKDCLVRFTGNAIDRIVEDYLRVLRMYRFVATLSTFDRPWYIAGDSRNAIEDNAEMIAAGLRVHVSKDRIVQEVGKLFKSIPTLDAIQSINSIPRPIRRVIFDDKKSIRLVPTTEKTSPSPAPKDFSLTPEAMYENSPSTSQQQGPPAIILQAS